MQQSVSLMFLVVTVLSITMPDTQQDESPLDIAAGAAGPHVTNAFELLANETRLAILVALWEAFDPLAADNAVTFSELRDRVGVRDSGKFNYHLGKLDGHFIDGTEDGYVLRNAGLHIVHTVISGTGLGQESLSPTVTERSCERCGAPTELRYEDELLVVTCTECSGNFGSGSRYDFPEGTLTTLEFEPAGLTHRSAGDLFVAGTIKFLRDLGSYIRGVCPHCSGAIESSLQICDDHETEPGEFCSNCGTREEIRVYYVCSVCKAHGSFPGYAAIHDHPDLDAFRRKHGIEWTYGLDDPEACGRLWDHLKGQEQTLLSRDPIRFRVTYPGNGEELHLTLNGDLDVIETNESIH